jgi:hypothetical protein
LDSIRLILRNGVLTSETEHEREIRITDDGNGFIPELKVTSNGLNTETLVQDLLGTHSVINHL